MRRKLRFLVTFGLLICLTLGGCGKGEQPAEGLAEEIPARVEETEELEESEETEEVAEELEEEKEAEEVVEKPEEAEADVELHGIIALVCTTGIYVADKDWYIAKYDLIKIDPTNGDVQVANSFCVPLSFVEDGRKYRYTPLHESFLSYESKKYPLLIWGNYREFFSPDYTKLAVSRIDLDSQEVNAGWFNLDSSFTNVTEILNPNLHNGFYEVVYNCAVNFTSNGDFVYSENTSGASLAYCVPPSMLSQENVTEYILPKRMETSVGRIQPTDVIDADNYLVNYNVSPYTCKKYNVTTQEVSDFIPETTRCNWSAVLSPDGTTVAFLSKTTEYEKEAEIFTIPLDGGEPVKINMVPSLRNMYGDISSNISGNGTSCFLLDWLE